MQGFGYGEVLLAKVCTVGINELEAEAERRKEKVKADIFAWSVMI